MFYCGSVGQLNWVLPEKSFFFLFFLLGGVQERFIFIWTTSWDHTELDANLYLDPSKDNLCLIPSGLFPDSDGLILICCFADAGGERPCGAHDWRITPRSDHPDGAVRDRKPAEQVPEWGSWTHHQPPDNQTWFYRRLWRCPPGFERLWWSLGRSILRIRVATGSTCTTCWPPSVTALFSSKPSAPLSEGRDAAANVRPEK